MMDVMEPLMPTEEEILARVSLDANPENPVARLREMQLLTAFARALKAEFAVETGSFTGSFAQALALQCPTTFSIDIYSHPPTRARGPGIFLRDPELWNSIHFIWGDGVDKLPHLMQFRPPDRPWVFFHDSDHSYAHVLRELNTAKELSVSGVGCHDIIHNKADGCEAAFDEFVKMNRWVPLKDGNIAFACPEGAF